MDISDHFTNVQRAIDSGFMAEHARIANTVNSIDDDVYVTLPNSEAPQQRVLVAFWQLGVAWNGVTLTPRWPTRDMDGVALYLDTGEICLIY